MNRTPYVWGSLNNTEPPDDDEDIAGYYGAPGVTPAEDDAAIDAAMDGEGA